MPGTYRDGVGRLRCSACQEPVRQEDADQLNSDLGCEPGVITACACPSDVVAHKPLTIFDADDPLVVNGTYDREGFRPNERKQFEKKKSKISGAVECNQHSAAPNHSPEIGGLAAMAIKDSINKAHRKCPQCGGLKSFDALKCRACTTIADPVERFWSCVDRSGACWLWTRGKTRAGYGVFSEAKHKLFLAHRYSWELTNGPIQPGLFVCHTCDTPRCVRPDHLFLGTNAENMEDASRKGRLVGTKNPKRGESSPNAKLTTADVETIRVALAAGESQSSLGRRFGVTQGAIWRIKNGKVWRDQ